MEALVLRVVLLDLNVAVVSGVPMVYYLSGHISYCFTYTYIVMEKTN